MSSVGIRELRQRASELIRRVEAGETIEITDRGRPVARLTPLPTGSMLEQLRASGDLVPATSNEFPKPLPLPPGAEPPSKVLERLRRDER
jgi:prevent-host-death family protein